MNLANIASDRDELYQAIAFDPEKYRRAWLKHGYRYENIAPTITPLAFYDESPEIQQMLITWIEAHCFDSGPGTRPALVVSNALRNMMQTDTGVYVNHNSMRGALLHCRWIPNDLYHACWMYRRMRVWDESADRAKQAERDKQRRWRAQCVSNIAHVRNELAFRTLKAGA